MVHEHIYHRLSKNKNKLPKLTWIEIFNYLKELYPLSALNFHESMWNGTYIRLICNSAKQEIDVKLNKTKYYIKGEIASEKKIEDISKNSYIFYMKNIDQNIINKYKLQNYIHKD